ncbi:MAG: YdiU family protein [Bacteroidota bacterium]
MSSSTALLSHSYADVLPDMGVAWQARPASDPGLVVVNESLAEEVGLDTEWMKSEPGLGMLVGTVPPEGAMPVAMAYAGHQFGGYSPLLGDGRALLMGELTTADGALIDVHLKGSGRTPFARGGDGRATLPAMLREYLIAEAMHALGIPTTRSLAVVTTGEDIVRDVPVPGAVLTRLAASHLRVGSLQFAASRREDPDLVQRVADYAIARHYPSLADRDDRYLAFLNAVVDAQASLVAQWMLVGFIHGVMNTDNMLVSGETIDYGPCAFLDRFNPATVYSSIDLDGRYAYGNQPAMAQWNLVRLAETLLGLIDDDLEAAVEAVTEGLHAFPDRYRLYWEDGMQAKLGLRDRDSSDAERFDALLSMMQAAKADYTSTFRSLSDALRGDESSLRAQIHHAHIEGWISAWKQRLVDEGADLWEVAETIDRVNPIYIPRNHLVEEALDAAGRGNLAPFQTLLDVVTHPFEEREEHDRYAAPASEAFTARYKTFCGT